MPRNALLASLMIHASGLAMISQLVLSTAMHPENAGVAFSLPSDDSVAFLLPDSAPAAPSEPETAPLQFPPPPVKVLIAASAPVPADIGAPIEAPKEALQMSPGKSHGASHRMITHSTGNTSGPRGLGSGTGDAGRGYVPPQFRSRYKPPYPPAARAQRMEGTVLLLVAVDAAGRVTGASISRTSGHAMLDHAALEAVRSWRFDPARQDGVAIAACVEIPVRFQLA